MAHIGLQEFLAKLRKNHNILREREAAYGTLAAPLSLLNQIEHYQQAISLTEHAIEQDIGYDDLQAELDPLNLDLHERIEIQVSHVRKEFTGQNPYRGLERFNEGDAAFFFGRTEVVKKLLDQINTLVDTPTSGDMPDLIAVLGASGSGKSSLVRAGLLPALRRGEIAGSENWPIAVILPGPRPLDALAGAFTVALGRGLGPLKQELQAGSEALHDLMVEALVKAGQPEEAVFVLVVDQFEELFTQCENEVERRAFLNLLLRACQIRGNRGFVIITMRADFYARAGAYKDLADAITKHQLLVASMTPAELREAILLPAEAVGLEIEKELALALVQDTAAEPGALPLLQHALLELFNRRRENNVLTMTAYEEIGGVKGALAHRADQVLAQLTPMQRQLARHIFIRLTSLGEGVSDTRRRVMREELYPSGVDAGQIDAVLQALSDKKARLVVSDEETVEVTHEALIQQWGVLRHWLEEDREALRTHRRLTESAEEWAENDRESSYLYRGGLLAGAREWAIEHRDDLTDTELAFLQASIDEAEREETERRTRNQRILIGLTVALILVTLGAVFGFVNRNQAIRSEQTALAEADNAATQAAVAIEARQQAENAEATAQAEKVIADEQRNIAVSRQLATESVRELGNANHQLALLLALKAEDTAHTLEAEDVLRQVLLNSFREMNVEQIEATVEQASFSPNGDLIAVLDGDGTVRLIDAFTGRLSAQLEETGNGAVRLEFSPNGQMFVKANDDYSLDVWNTSTGELISNLKGHASTIDDVAFDNTGDTVVTISGEDNTARMWRVQSGEELLVLGPLVEADDSWTVVGTSEVIYRPLEDSIVTITTGSRSNVGPSQAIVIWDSASGQIKVRHQNNGDSDLIGWRFEDDGWRIVKVEGKDTLDRRTYLIDALSGAELVTLPGSSSYLSAKFSPTGESLATWDPYGDGHIWDANIGREIAIIEEKGSGTGSQGRHGFRDIVLSPSGLHIATVGFYPGGELWGLNGELVAQFDNVDNARFSPDGSLLLTTANNKAIVWGGTSGERIQEFTGVDEAKFGPIGNAILTVQGQEVSIWRTGAEVALFAGHTNSVRQASFNQDGTLVLTGSSDGTTRLWGPITGREVRRQRFSNDTAGYVVDSLFGSGGDLVLSSYGGFGNAGGGVSLWETNTGEIVGQASSGYAAGCYDFDSINRLALCRMNTMHASGLNVLDSDTLTSMFYFPEDGAEGRLSPDGRMILTYGGYYTPTVKLWNAQNGEELRELEGRKYADFDPAGQQIVVHDTAGSVAVIDIDTFEELVRLMGDNPGDEPFFSPDGQKLVTRNENAANVWDVQTGMQLAELRGHTDLIIDIQFSADSSQIVTASRDRTARIWNAATGEAVSILRGHERTVNSAVFSPDGKYVLTASGDGTARLYFASVEDVITAVSRLKTRSLTCDEQLTYHLSDTASCQSTAN